MSTPALRDLADHVVSSRRSFVGGRGAHVQAEMDQAGAVVRSKLEQFGVDLDNPIAARAIIALFEISSSAAHSRVAAGTPAGVGTAMGAGLSIVGAAADVAAARHARRSR